MQHNRNDFDLNNLRQYLNHWSEVAFTVGLFKLGNLAREGAAFLHELDGNWDEPPWNNLTTGKISEDEARLRLWKIYEGLKNENTAAERAIKGFYWIGE